MGPFFILISACELRKSTADLDELREFMLITYRPFRSIGDQDLGGCLHQAARPSRELAKVQTLMLSRLLRRSFCISLIVLAGYRMSILLRK